ncbi:vacuolar protein sorting-associated protein 8 homolog isoform X2 [Anguilla anguilla]|uniref:vacuolar protein sorting-associated protein 8 homolog isoform X2 n=1 Tax=Anguilla anguilla TaxID=7936 RepID=UPI0015B2DCAB|nr:vacuolar protein sorting-associated protein 8 homolog isoform X2 [Anguilla anguilla]XP_035269675.1 vacuolar protein sorting-associated protein 8 homolog isoform X2 [Anguilla anguilla]XP_035269676.1 vacuolar protein sorting-associated protein 8 homolog isoform X2 [Anguilla anguilla]
MVQTVKSQVFTCLTSIQVKGIEASKEPYPFIRTLLQYNTREFLNVLALAFEDLEQDEQAIEFHQRMIDILLQVMLESTDFSPSQIGSLFTFLACQLAKAENNLFVNHQLFHQALDFLCNPEDTTQHAERQQALLELLQAGGAAYFEEHKLLSMAEAVHFYQVCEFVYEQKRLYHRIVTCYLKDPARKGYGRALNTFRPSAHYSGTSSPSVSEHQSLWTPSREKTCGFLDFLMSPSEQVQGSLSPEMERGIKDLTKEVLDGMTAYIPLMAILQRLMQFLELDPGQIAASDCLRRVFKNQSRISILMDLIRQTSSSMDSSKPGSDIFRHAGILESADLKLNLAPPP